MLPIHLKTLACSAPLALLCAAGGAQGQVRPLSLKQAVEYAMTHRPELRASGDLVAAAEKNKVQAGTRPNPRLLFRKEDFVNHPGFGQSSQTYYEGSELLETSGKRGGRIAVADQDLAHIRLQSEVDRRRIALNVRELYWKAEAEQQLQALYAEDDKFFGQTIAYNEARFKEGKLAEVDLLRVQLQGQQIHAAAATASLDADRAKLELSQEMNAPAEDWVLESDFENVGGPAPVLAHTAVNSQRPEALLSDQAIAQTEAQLRLARANRRPDLLLTGGYKRDVDINTPVASVQFDLPLFNRNRAAIGALQAEQSAAREENAATQNRLAAELALARKTYEARRAQYVETFKPLRARAIQISDITRAAYQAGGLDLLRLLDAERTRVDAQLSYVRALEAVHLSVVDLDYAEGVEP